MDHIAESLCLAAFDVAEADSRHANAKVLSLANKAQGGLAVSIEGIAKAYDEKTVLSRLSLNIAPGAFVVIIGKSGCGKSTFLRLLAGLETPDSGRILFGSPARAREAGDVRVMFQEPRLLPWASILDNVTLGLGEAGDAASRQAAARLALAAVGLEDRAGEWPSVLSGGQKQRVALARALVSGPGVLALDEPLGALDALTRIDMQAFLESVWQEQGLTALMVTHDVAEAVTLADRILLIEDGIVALDQAVDLPRPRRRGDADFGALEGLILNRLMQRAG